MGRHSLMRLLFAGLLLAACSGQTIPPDSAPEPPAPTPPPVKEAPTAQPLPEPPPVVAGDLKGVFVAAAQDGPWQQVEPGALLVPGHQYLQLRFDGVADRDLHQWLVAGYSTPLDALPRHTWTDDHTVVVHLTDLPTVFGLKPWSSGGPEERFLYQGGPPEVVATATGGESRLVSRLDFHVDFVWLDGAGRGLNVAHRQEGRDAESMIDLEDGSLRPATERPVSPPKVTNWENAFADYRWTAPPGGERVARLLIERSIVGEELLSLPLEIQNSAGEPLFAIPDFFRLLPMSTGCANDHPTLAWRPDGGALAAAVATGEERLGLKLLDMETREVRLLAERPGHSFRVWADQLIWSPNQTRILFGPVLFDVQSGEVVAENLGMNGWFNADGSKLLILRRSVFRSWGDVAIVDTSTGAVTELGAGWPVGWSKAGEAVWVRWSAGPRVPLPPRDCG